MDIQFELILARNEIMRREVRDVIEDARDFRHCGLELMHELKISKLRAQVKIDNLAAQIGENVRRIDNQDRVLDRLMKENDDARALVAAFISAGSSRESIHPKERRTFHRIIIGMAIDGYRYDPTKARSSFPRELSEILSELGLAVGDDAIRGHLREAAEQLGGNPSDHYAETELG